MDEKKIVIVIPSYNNAQWHEKNLASVLSQSYTNFRAIYTDDCSSDGTGALVEKYIKENNQEEKIKLIKNETRLGALHNLYNMIHSCEDNEIILTLDGDDWFAHSNVLNRVNQAYTNGNVWITYGQYKDSRGGLGCSRQIPANVIKNRSYRFAPWCTSHLRTFYAGLFKKIKKEDLQDDNGKFYSMTWDLFMYFAMLEMGGHHSQFISDILYIYNIENPIQDYKVNRNLQIQLEKRARSRPQYPVLNEVPWA